MRSSENLEALREHKTNVLQTIKFMAGPQQPVMNEKYKEKENSMDTSPDTTWFPGSRAQNCEQLVAIGD